MATTAPPTVLIPPPPPSGGGLSGDQKRLIWILETTLLVLDKTVHLEPPPFPPELRPLLLDSWPEAEKSLRRAITVLRGMRFRTLYPRLQAAGLTGQSLEMKAASLYYHSEPYVGEFITYGAKKTWGERIARFFRPAFKVMNSIMSSLKGIVPGIEIAKEYKEHVEAAADAMEEKE